MLCLDSFDRFGQLRLRVLDYMPFVKNAVEPIDIFQTRNVIANDFVRGNHNIHCGQLGEKL